MSISLRVNMCINRVAHIDTFLFTKYIDCTVNCSRNYTKEDMMNFKIGHIEISVSGVSIRNGNIAFDLRVETTIGSYRVLLQSAFRQAEKDDPLELVLNVVPKKNA